MKTQCTQSEFELQEIAGKSVTVKNDGAQISSDGGLVLLAQLERKYKIISRVSEAFVDLRNPKLIQHELVPMLRQRIYGLCQGYEDINDHDAWRTDPLLAIACGKVPNTSMLAGKGTLNRLELGAKTTDAKCRYKNIRYHEDKLPDTFIDLYMKLHPLGRKAPKEIIIDVDATDDPIHGNQEGRVFNGYYDEYCYLPLYMFIGPIPVWAELMTADKDPATGVVPALKLIIRAIRLHWKKTRIILRGDSGFCRTDILEWCEQENISYVIGLPKNKRLTRAIGGSIHAVADAWKKTGEPQRIFRDIRYKTKKTWKKARRVIGKAEHLALGPNPRFIVTNLETQYGSARSLYEDLYCARGDMENRIKEQKLFMFASRLSTHTVRANQLRLYFSTIAYLFMVILRISNFDDPDIAIAQASTIRLRFLKVGAQVTVSVRRIVIHIAESYPYWNSWLGIQQQLNS